MSEYYTEFTHPDVLGIEKQRMATELCQQLGVDPTSEEYKNRTPFDLGNGDGLVNVHLMDGRPTPAELTAAGLDTEFRRCSTVVLDGVESHIDFGDIRRELDAFGVPTRVRAKLLKDDSSNIRTIFVEFYNPKMADKMVSSMRLPGTKLPNGLVPQFFEGHASVKRWTIKPSLTEVNVTHTHDMVLDSKTGQILAPCMFGVQARATAVGTTPERRERKDSADTTTTTVASAGASVTAMPTYQSQQVQMQQMQQQMLIPPSQMPPGYGPQVGMQGGGMLPMGMILPPMPPGGLMLGMPPSNMLGGSLGGGGGGGAGGMIMPAGMSQMTTFVAADGSIVQASVPPPPPPMPDMQQQQQQQQQMNLPLLTQVNGYHSRRPRSNTSCSVMAMEAHDAAKAYIESDCALVPYYVAETTISGFLGKLEQCRLQPGGSSSGAAGKEGGGVMDYATEVELACMMANLHLVRGHYSKAQKALRNAMDLGQQYSLKYGAHKKKEMQFIVNDVLASLSALSMFEVENDMMPHPDSTLELYSRLVNPQAGCFLRSATGDQILKPNASYQLPFNPTTGQVMPRDMAGLLFPEATSQLAAHLLLGSLSPVTLFMVDE